MTDAPRKPNRGGRPREGVDKLEATVAAALSYADYERLCEEARQRNLSRSALVRILLRAQLQKPPSSNGNGTP